MAVYRNAFEACRKESVCLQIFSWAKFLGQWKISPSLKSALCLYLKKVHRCLCVPADCHIVQQSSDDMLSYHVNRLPHIHHVTCLPAWFKDGGGWVFFVEIWTNCCNGNISLNVFQGVRIHVLKLHVIKQQSFTASQYVYLHCLQHVRT